MADNHTTCLCPRCGYDLRGVAPDRHQIDQHATGLCAECGLNFTWRDIFDPSRTPPLWCVESCSRAGFLLAIAHTYLKCFIPWRFWRQIRMDHQPRWRRIAAYLVCFLPVAYIGFAIGHGMLAANEWSIWRVNGVPSTTGFEAALHAALMPFSNAPAGTVVGAGGTWNMLPSGQLIQAWFDWLPLGGLAIFAATFLLAAPFVFAILPIARKRAKVRWRHITRISLYSTPLLIPGFFTVMLVSPPMVSYRTTTLIFLSFSTLWSVLYWTALVGTWLLYLSWWTTAAKHYLRMTRPLAVGLSVVIIATLAGWVVLSLTHPEFVQQTLGRFFGSPW